jgi:hypothetical protein
MITCFGLVGDTPEMIIIENACVLPVVTQLFRRADRGNSPRLVAVDQS